MKQLSLRGFDEELLQRIRNLARSRGNISKHSNHPFMAKGSGTTREPKRGRCGGRLSGSPDWKMVEGGREGIPGNDSSVRAGRRNSLVMKVLLDTSAYSALMRGQLSGSRVRPRTGAKCRGIRPPPAGKTARARTIAVSGR